MLIMVLQRKIYDFLNLLTRFLKSSYYMRTIEMTPSIQWGDCPWHEYFVLQIHNHLIGIQNSINAPNREMQGWVPTESFPY